MVSKPLYKSSNFILLKRCIKDTTPFPYKIYMLYNPENNKWLKLREGIIRTPSTDIVICKLDPFFGEVNHTASVTSIKREPTDQLRIIKNYILQKHLDKDYPEIFTCGLDDKTLYQGKEVYKWQLGWSKLLNIGVIINSPYEAEVLLDYFKNVAGSTNKVNKKGSVIRPSVHFLGLAFDISGGSNNVDDEIKIISEAMKRDKKLGIINYVSERENNCCHVNCWKI